MTHNANIYSNSDSLNIKIAVGFDELDVAPFLDGETTQAGSYTWADHQAANQLALDDIAAALGVERD